MVVVSGSACLLHENMLCKLESTGHGRGACASGLWEEGLGAGGAGQGLPEQWAPLCILAHFTPRARWPLAQLCPRTKSPSGGRRQVLLLGVG